MEPAGAVSPEQDRLVVVLWGDVGVASCILNCCLLLLGRRSSFGKAAKEASFRERFLSFK